jgi:hypothetical protein
MLIAEYTQKTKIPIDVLWNKITNVEEWKKWDDTIEFSEIDGPIENQSIGIIKEKGGESAPFIVLELEHFKRMVELRKSYFGKFKIYREIRKIRGNILSFTQKIELISPVSIFVTPFISNKLNRSLKQSIIKLLTLSQEDSTLYETTR